MTWEDTWEQHRATLDGWSTEDEWLFEAAYKLGQRDLIRQASQGLETDRG